MKKILIAALMLASGIANAENEFRYTTNNAGGYMFFTTTYCVWKATGERVPNQFYIYSTNDNGTKIVDGCYYYKSPFYFIEWNGGGKTSILVSSTQAINK